MDRGKKERLKKVRCGEEAQGLWCCRAPVVWRRKWGLKACAGTTAPGQQRKQMWPWFTSAGYQWLLIHFNLPAMPHSYSISFLSPLLWHLPLTQMSPPTFALPRCLAAPLITTATAPHPPSSPAWSTRSAIVIQPKLRCFNPLSVLPSSSRSHWDVECELLSAPSSPFTQPHYSDTAEILSRRWPLFLLNHVSGAGYKCIYVENHYPNEL